MSILSGAQAVVTSLRNEGVKYVFGIPGGPILPLYDALYDASSPKHILVRHEEAAAFMADAYARVTGRPQVCVGTMGPGAANLLIGVACAFSDSIPLIAITGNVSTAFEGRGLQQEMDHVRVFTPVTKRSIKVHRTERIPEILQMAFRVATTGRPGPVLIDVPSDVLSREAEVDFVEPSKARPTSRRLYGDPEEIRRAAQLLVDAERRIILAGGGVIISNASTELTTLAETLISPVVTSYNGRGAIPEDHSLFLGRAGSGAPTVFDEVIREADVVLAVGYRFTDVSTNNWSFPSGNAEIIHVDIDPCEIGRIVPVEVGVVGDSRAVLSELLQAVGSRLAKRRRQRGWIEDAFRRKEVWETRMMEKMTSDAVPIKPHRVMKELREVLDRNAILATSAGSNKMFAASLFRIYEPRTWIHSGGSTPMGAAFCHALGAKLAAPDRQVVAVCGDGGFQMVCQELVTAVENDLNVVTCILNDQRLGLIRYQQQKQYGGRVIATEFRHSTDFVKLAEAFGATGIRVEKPQEMKPSLKRALQADTPVVIDIVIDGEEAPQL
ncbi:MAG: biosynthetic-type acetolactate synthase large subunit [Candidatus Bathyarchaeota archaeon]|nr:biosynthetic-type acetolactate synthase large subunit [Candidatus Bathyarchaeota archaeon]